MANPFFEANDAAMDRAVDLMLGATTQEPATPAEPEPAAAAPASGPEGTTLSNDDGAIPAAQDASGAGKAEGDGTPEPSTEDILGFDPEKTLAKYATPEEKDKALVESQRTILERSEENKRLKAEIESLKGKPKADEPEPEEPAVEVEPYDKFLARMNGAKPEELDEDERPVAQSISALKAERAALTKAQKEVLDLQAQEQTIEGEASKLKLILEAQEADLAKDPDDFNLQRRIEENRTKLDGLERQSDRLRSKRIDKNQTFMQQASAFDKKLVDFDREAQGFLAAKTQTKQATAAHAKDVSSLNSQWVEGQKKLFDGELKQHGFTEDEREVIAQGLAHALSEHHSKTGEVPPDLFEFQRSQKAVVDRVLKIRNHSQQSLLERKASDLPRKPRDNEGRDSSRGGTPSSPNNSWKSTLKTAESRFDRMLGL